MRAAVGKTCSDQGVIEGYKETTTDSLRDCREFVRWCNEKWPKTKAGGEGLVVPVVTPRFVSTHMEDREMSSSRDEIGSQGFRVDVTL